MKSTDLSDIAQLRREQIIEAAIAVIAEQGIQNLSLSEIEKKANMSRGQLTYYFRTKESILLGVFEVVLEKMVSRVHEAAGLEVGPACRAQGWELIQVLLSTVLTQTPMPEFDCLQYTFLAQVGHREDYRQRLATLYEEWRSHLADGLAVDHAAGRISLKAPPRVLATVVQALLHGLVMQAVADPQAYDPHEVVAVCLHMLGNYLGVRMEKTPWLTTDREGDCSTPSGSGGDLSANSEVNREPIHQ
jgi:AcrR family transcriptional regulator